MRRAVAWWLPHRTMQLDLEEWRKDAKSMRLQRTMMHYVKFNIGGTFFACFTSGDSYFAWARDGALSMNAYLQTKNFSEAEEKMDKWIAALEKVQNQPDPNDISVPGINEVIRDPKNHFEKIAKVRPSNWRVKGWGGSCLVFQNMDILESLFAIFVSLLCLKLVISKMEWMAFPAFQLWLRCWSSPSLWFQKVHHSLVVGVALKMMARDYAPSLVWHMLPRSLVWTTECGVWSSQT